MNIVQKFITPAMQPKAFQGGSRFDDAAMTEWHIISTDQPDHIGDVMVLDGMYLPASGRSIVLLNHDRTTSSGLPVGKKLEHRVVVGDGGRKELWQLTQYSSRDHEPDAYKGLGEATYRCRKDEFFVDSSIQFIGTLKEPIDPEEVGLAQWQWSGTRYKEWLLLEAGPVLIGMNQFTGDMKSATPEAVAALRKALGVSFKNQCTGCGFCSCGHDKEKSGGQRSASDSDGGRSIRITQPKKIKLTH